MSRHIITMLSTALLLLILCPNVFAGKNEAENLWEAGSKATEAKRYPDAIRLFERSLALCGNDIDCRWANLNGLGVVYDALDQNERARGYYEQTLQLSRQRNNPEDLANDLVNLGALLYKGLEQHQKALPLLEESLKLYRQIRKESEVALLLFHLGTVKTTLGRYPEAIRDLQESLAINRRLKNDAGTSNALATLGQAYNMSGNYSQAAGPYDEAIAIQRRSRLDEDLCSSLNRKGLNEFDLRRIPSALTTFDEALKIAKRLGDKRQEANILNNIGVVLKDAGQYEQARNNYQQALILAQKLGRKGMQAVASNNVGDVYAALGQQDKALSFYQESLRINREIGARKEIATNLNNIAMVYYQAKRYDEAINWHRQGLDLKRSIGNKLDIALGLSNLAAAYLFKGDLTTAERLLDERRLLQINKSGVHLRHPGLVEIYLQTSRFDQALSLLLQQLPSALAGDQVVAEHEMQTGRALMGRGDYAGASRHLLKSYQLLEELRSSVVERGTFLTAGGGGGRFRTYRALTASVAEQALRGEPIVPELRNYGGNSAAAAFYFAEASKARTLIERVAESGRSSVAASGLPAAVREEEQQLRQQLVALEAGRDKAVRGGTAMYSQYQQQRQILHRQLDQMTARLQRDYPVYAAINYPSPVAAEQLPLAAGELLLAYALGEDASYLFVVRKGGVQRVVRIPLKRSVLEEKVKNFLEPLTNHHQQDFSQQQAAELYRLLLAEGLSDARPADRLIIVPDGILGTLPFEILAMPGNVSAKEVSCLGDRYAVSYYQSASLLALKRTLPGGQPTRTLFALGNPDFGTTPGSQQGFRGLSIVPKQYGQQVLFPPLPETETEVRRIAALLGTAIQPPDILLGAQASEAMLKQSPLGTYRYLHFATHASLPGMIQEVNEPFILLSQRDKRSGSDGFLTLSEVLDLKLNAEVVMLSACVTGVGKEVEGEGVANFARAFQSAGAGSVVVSLWEVASEPAVEYVTLLYGYLKQGKSHARALKLAREQMRKKYPNPFYWGVFVLHGEG
ncbi:MAG: tetratricopeptide repeat protein [Trichlorobacter sp.]|uniref:CHAT domain-containing protein n=1 Tax=Trichlorobacter sp. TaxID=2911007 RepID=UPI00256C29CC|nr:tetratricopeptide repeat protein [Trichlorobacter sp.]MDK9718694.1 tetratricopeptide repeat protein [Trichlorobacter sp.]